MRSLADNYSATHSSTHETIADLVFCALVVLILFVLALTVEVSQRVRAASVATVAIPQQEIEQVETMSADEIKALGDKLQSQRRQIESLRQQLQVGKSKVEEQLAAMAGEQRFTGAREPAAFSMVYNYDTQRYYFAPSSDVNHADRRQSGESIFEFSARKTQELVDIALKLRKSRGYSKEEVIALYTALSTYMEVAHSGETFYLNETEMGLYYHVLLSGFVAGDTETSDVHEEIVTRAISAMARNHGPKGDQCYPRVTCKIDNSARTIDINSVVLAPRDFLQILMSVSGRGILLDFEGYTGDVPKWLYEEVLMPAGYFSKMPKLPTR